MTTDVLNQLRALRESIAETLRKDPRYLTLAALDKSIVEINGVLKAAGITAPEPAPAKPLQFEAPPSEPPATAPHAVANPAPPTPGFKEPPAPAAASGASVTSSAAAALAPTAEPVGLPEPVMSAPGVKSDDAPAAAESEKDQKEILAPVAAAAGVSAIAGLADEIIGESHAAAAAKNGQGEAEAEQDAGEEPPTVAEHVTPMKNVDPDETADAFEKTGESDAKGDDEDSEDEAPRHQDHPIATDVHGTAAASKEDKAPEDTKTEGDETEDEVHDGLGRDRTVHDGEAIAEPHVEGKGIAQTSESAEVGKEGAAVEDNAETPVIPHGKASGYSPMQAKPGANQYQPAMSVKFGRLPNKVDLRPLMTPVEDQGDTRSCVANAVAGAYEYWIKKASKQDHAISRLFVYYNARWRDGSQDKDDGSVIQLAMEGLAKFGACNEKVWPFDPHLILQKPGADAYQDAAPYKVHDMAQVPLKLESWKQALAEGKPIVFGCELFGSFDECSKRGGVVAMPAPDDIARKTHSGHSMCAVGYSDTEKVFIVRNSWGAGWGDKGYCYMPYAYLMSEKFNDGDCWVFIPKVPSQPPREVWSDDTTPVTNGGQGVDFLIEPYTVADYAKIPVDLFETIRKPFNGVVLESFANYVSLAGKGLWSEMERFDVRTFLISTAALAGVAAVAAELSGSSTASSGESSSPDTSTSSHGSEASAYNASDEAEDEDSDDAEEDGDEAEDAEEDDVEGGDDDAEDPDDEDGDAEDDDDDDDDDDDKDETK